MTAMPGVRHVYICGAHSTGKTTLLNHLRKYPMVESLGLKFQEEIARKIVENSEFTQEKLKNPSVLLELNRLILKKLHDTIVQEEQNTSNHGLITLWDRGVMDPLTYITEYVSNEARLETERLDYVAALLARSRKSDQSLFFIIKPCPEFLKDDGVRYQSGGFDSLESFHVTMTSLMRCHSVNYIEVEQQDLNERAKFVVDSIVTKWGLT